MLQRTSTVDLGSVLLTIPIWAVALGALGLGLGFSGGRGVWQTLMVDGAQLGVRRRSRAC